MCGSARNATVSEYAIPPHVRPDQVVDFDIYHVPGAEHDVHLAWKELHKGPDIFWTPRNGGHWIAVRGEDIDFIQRNFDPFSHGEVVIPKGMLPEKLVPLELDPPEHTAYRALLNPALTPKAIEGLESDARALCASLIEGFYRNGECEFVADFAKRLPIVLFLRLVNLPLEDRDRLLEWTEHATRGSAEDKVRAHTALMRYLAYWVELRRRDPGKDLISTIVNAQIEGKPIPEGRMRGMLQNVLFGGLDTVAAMLSFFARFLAMNPGHRRQLAADPGLIPNAVEELIRRHGVANTARILSRDYEYKGVQFRKGEQVWVPNMMYGLDERKYADALSVDFSRKVTIHAAFGAGPHRCPGSFLARTELKVFVQEWLRRIPEFEIKPGATVKVTNGAVHSVANLPLVWIVH